MFDLLRVLSGGEVRDVACLLERVTTERTEDCFAASMAIDFPDRAPGEPSKPLLASLYGSRATDSRSSEIRVLGERGQIVADDIHRRVAVIRGWTIEPRPRSARGSDRARGCCARSARSPSATWPRR
jgi:hypothetical protein